jgi:hypothetical protein
MEGFSDSMIIVDSVCKEMKEGFDRLYCLVVPV